MSRVVPSGAPYWSRANAFGNYGGNASKSAYASIPALGGDTDLDPADFNRGPTDLAACARSQAFCIMQLTSRETTAEDPLVNYVALPTGVYLGEPYDGGNPPAGFPGIVRNFAGNMTVTLGSAYSDAYGVEQEYVVTGARATLAYLAILGQAATAERLSDSEVTVEYFDNGGTSLFDQTVTVEIW